MNESREGSHEIAARPATPWGRARRTSTAPDLLALVLVVLSALAGCDGGSLVGLVCWPGEIRSCRCSDGTDSWQLCVEEGRSWGSCECGTDPAGGCEAIYCPVGWVCDPTRLVCRPETSPDAGLACPEETVLLTETREAFPVPAGVSYMHVKAWGSGGNGEQGCVADGTEPNGGPGGFTEAIFEVTPGEPLVIFVGWRAQLHTTAEEIARYGFPAAGGGGLSGVFRGPAPVAPTDRDRALMVAGGGGSAGAPGCHPGGAGNHPDAGGEETMQGTRGRDDINGGGGGYHGGSGGARGAIGRGGTGYASPEALDSVMLFSEPGIYVDPPRASDPDYSGEAGMGERNGLVVIRFTCERPSL